MKYIILLAVILISCNGTITVDKTDYLLEGTKIAYTQQSYSEIWKQMQELHRGYIAMAKSALSKRNKDSALFYIGQSQAMIDMETYMKYKCDSIQPYVTKWQAENTKP